jgi:hypothetical protein
MDMSDEATTVNFHDWFLGKSLVMSPTTILTYVSLNFRYPWGNALPAPAQLSFDCRM